MTDQDIKAQLDKFLTQVKTVQPFVKKYWWIFVTLSCLLLFVAEPLVIYYGWFHYNGAIVRPNISVGDVVDQHNTPEHAAIASSAIKKGNSAIDKIKKIQSKKEKTK